MISYSDNQNSYQYNCAIVNSPGNKDNPNFEVLGERISIRRTPVGFEFNTFTLNSFDDYVKVFQNNGFVINDKNQILNDNFPKIRKYFERSNGAAILAFKKMAIFIVCIGKQVIKKQLSYLTKSSPLLNFFRSYEMSYYFS